MKERHLVENLLKFTVAAILLVLWYVFYLGINLHNYIIAALLLTFALFYVYKFVLSDMDQKKANYHKIGAILYISCFLSRATYCFLVNPYFTQWSDFKCVLDSAATGVVPEYFSLNTHKAFFPLILNQLSITTQGEIMLFQCAVVSFIPVVLVLIGKELQRETIGVIAAFVYLLWPTQTLYIAVLTEEHIAALLVCLIALVVAKFINGILTEQACHTCILYAILIGILSGFCAFFKDWAIVLLLALFIGGILLIKRPQKKFRKVFVLSIAIILLCRSGAQLACDAVIDAKTGMRTQEISTIAQIFETMDPTGSGAYDAEKWEQFKEIYYNNGGDKKSVMREVREYLLDRITKNYRQVPSFLTNKGRIAFDGNNQILHIIFNEGMGERRELLSDNIYVIGEIDKVFYTVVVLGIIITAFFSKDERIFVLVIFVLGSIMASLLVEPQGRYKYSIEPIWIFVASSLLLEIEATIKRTKIIELMKTKFRKANMDL